jgi:hypothetical protein
LFAPQSREDSDIFNLFVLAGYTTVQSYDSLIYHMTCRGSRFKDGIGKNSEEWQFTNYKGERNFKRKWGTMVLHSETLHPIIGSKYNWKLVIDLTNSKLVEKQLYEILTICEPWTTELHIVSETEIPNQEIEAYIANEQKITAYDMKKRIKYYQVENVQDVVTDDFDIVMITSVKGLMADNAMFVQSSNQIFDALKELGMKDYNGTVISVNKLKRNYYMENLPAT